MIIGSSEANIRICIVILWGIGYTWHDTIQDGTLNSHEAEHAWENFQMCPEQLKITPRGGMVRFRTEL